LTRRPDLSYKTGSNPADNQQLRFAYRARRGIDAV